MSYYFSRIKNNKWGIYLKDELLATVTSYELYKSIKELLNSSLSQKTENQSSDAPKQKINQ